MRSDSILLPFRCSSYFGEGVYTLRLRTTHLKWLAVARIGAGSLLCMDTFVFSLHFYIFEPNRCSPVRLETLCHKETSRRERERERENYFIEVRRLDALWGREG